MEKYGFVYIWFDRKHKRYYIGCRWGTEDDGYICSSPWMKRAHKYRPKDFTRKILGRVYSNRNGLLEEEYKWLSKIKDDELGTKYYNLHNHHFGHWSSNEENRKSVREKLSDASIRLHQDPEYREKYLEGLKKRPPLTKEQIQKRSDALRGKPRSEETKKKISVSNTGKVNGPLSDETKKKLSIALSGEKNPFYGKKHSPEKMLEISKKISITMKGRDSSAARASIVGSFWWNNGTTNKRNKECPGPEWIRGRF